MKNNIGKYILAALSVVLMMLIGIYNETLLAHMDVFGFTLLFFMSVIVCMFSILNLDFEEEES